MVNGGAKFQCAARLNPQSRAASPGSGDRFTNLGSVGAARQRADLWAVFFPLSQRLGKVQCLRQGVSLMGIGDGGTGEDQ